MKKVSIILAMTAIMVLATAGSAFANFGPHGGYALDTDACAGCHRAHTSFSDLTWQDTGGNNHSALLVSDASNMQEFCYACHGDEAPGASTNVQSGIFDSGPSGGIGVAAGTTLADGTVTSYETNSAFGDILNGGGFDSMPATSGVGFSAASSMHDMEKGALTDPMWGAGNTAPAGTNLTCTTCHDPHGSSNYRILKDSVNGKTVGGYAGETPQPFVFSSEEGYPAGGWLKHVPGAAQMTAYYPNYTTPEYQYEGAETYSGGQVRSMSTWCSACHEAYDDGAATTYNYGGYETEDASRVAGVLKAGTGVSVGARARHRHKVNITLGAGVGAVGVRTLAMEVVTSTVLPLEKREGAPATERGTWKTTDYLGCLTCHRAHGTQVAMEGWADASLITSASADVTWYPTMANYGGVNPNFSSSLLRTDNRGVCERCHNK